jgi:TRAP-type C4-dicarboxylate transport system substrate-binding protein
MLRRAKLFLAPASAIAAGLNMFCPTPAQAAPTEPMPLYFGSYESEPASTMVAMSAFDIALKRLSKNQLFISFEKLKGKKIDAISAKSKDDNPIDMTLFPYPIVFHDNLFELPFLFEHPAAPRACCDHRHAVMDQMMADGRAADDPQLVALALFDGSPRIIAGRRPVSRPGRLNGVFLYSTNKEDAAFFSSMKARARWLPFDVLMPQIMVGGDIAVSMAIDVYDELGVDKALPVLTYTDHARVPEVLVISQGRWQQLGDEFGERCQEKIRRVARLSALIQWGARERESEGIAKRLYQTVDDYEEVDQDEFREVAAPLWQPTASAYPIAKVGNAAAYEEKISELTNIDVDQELKSLEDSSDQPCAAR